MANPDQLSSKRQKLRRKADQNVIDRLSNLPEHILLHILSFLPTETVATTCVLSKSWQFLWCLVPNLDFDESRSHRTALIKNYHEYLRFEEYHDYIGYEKYQEYRSFANFVTKVLFHRRARFIRKFRLKCRKPYDPSEFDSWVSPVMAQTIEELDLDLGYNSHNIFRYDCTQPSCKTLVVLKLRSVLISGRLDKVSFPVLKIFHLKEAEFEQGEIKFLPPGFPVLEEFDFNFCGSKFEICLPKLRSLTLSADGFVSEVGDYGFVRVDCPGLTHLVLNDEYGKEFHLENLMSLVEANIDVGRSRISTDRVQCREHKDETYRRSVMSVVKPISNVGIMRLSYSTMMEIELASSYSDDIPVFHNLVKVELAFKGMEITILMLQKFENLECLTLYNKELDDWECDGRGVDTKELIQQTQVPNCLTSHLTTFCFRDFRDRGDEMKVTSYILKNSLVLRNMTILFSSSLSSEDGRPIRKKLRKSLKAPRDVNLNFCKKKKIGEGA